MGKATRHPIIALTLAAAPLPAPAAEPIYHGTWTVSEARVAPWANPQEDAFSAQEQRRLIGSKVIYRPTYIDARPPLSCAKTRYRVIEVPQEYLFQGGLTDPTAQARALGFRGPMITTLKTGCGGDIDFHFVDSTTALFALNNMIYTLRRPQRELDTPS